MEETSGVAPEAGAADATPAVSAPAADAPAAQPQEVELAQVLAEKISSLHDGSTEQSGGQPAESADAPAAEAAEASEEAAAADADKAPADEALPIEERWRKAQEELKTAQERAAELEQKIAQLNDAGDRFQRLVTFCEQYGLQNEDLNNLLHAGALLKTDPKAALEFMRPWFEYAAQAAGEKLPDDLAQEVEDGLISEQRAKELAALRMRSKAAEAAEASNSAKLAREQNEKAVSGIATAISNLERQWLASDPDYAKLQPRVQERFRDKLELWIRRESRLPTLQEATQMATEIRDSEYKLLRSLMPKSARTAVPRPAPAGSATTLRRNAQPANLAEHLANQITAMLS